MLKFYHNNRCSKCRTSLQYLKEKSIDVEVIEYLKNPLSKEELTNILNKLGKTAFEMVRTHEELYKTKYKNAELTNEEWIDVLVENPRLLKRPIVESETAAVWAVPAEEVEKIKE